MDIQEEEHNLKEYFLSKQEEEEEDDEIFNQDIIYDLDAQEQDNQDEVEGNHIKEQQITSSYSPPILYETDDRYNSIGINHINDLNHLERFINQPKPPTQIRNNIVYHHQLPQQQQSHSPPQPQQRTNKISIRKEILFFVILYLIMFLDRIDILDIINQNLIQQSRSNPWQCDSGIHTLSFLIGGSFHSQRNFQYQPQQDYQHHKPPMTNQQSSYFTKIEQYQRQLVERYLHYNSIGDIPNSISVLQEILKNYPYDCAARLRIAQLTLLKERNETTVLKVEKMIKSALACERWVKSEYIQELLLYYIEFDRFEEAIALSLRALTMFPDDIKIKSLQSSIPIKESLKVIEYNPPGFYHLQID